jgi:nitroreductase
MLMETWDAIRARRNVRRYAARPIPAEHLERVLEAGRRAPSSMNDQAWDFVLVTERERLARLARVWRYAEHVASSAATVALVLPATEDRDERDIRWFDLGQAAMAMMLAAADLGIGSSHAAVGDQELARELLGLPADRECAMLLALGYPAGAPLRPLERPARRPFDEVVHRERW